MSLLLKWNSNSTNGTRTKRSVHELQCTNVGSPTFWSDLRLIMTAIFVPGAAASKAMKLAEQLGCWTKDEFNKTSQILDMLTSDVQSVNHAVLQNRAAINFLLLAQGHGCDEFEGMCCMNLSDHAVSIHTKIKQLQQGLHLLKKEDGLGIENWLKGLGIGPWLRSLIMYAIGFLGVILLLLLLLPCILNCIRGMITNATQKIWQTNLLAQKENRGNVESFIELWMEERGHDKIQRAKLETTG